MKQLLLTTLLCFSFILLKAQNIQLQTNVVTMNGKIIKGNLQKIDSLGLIIKDYNGNHYILMANEIQKIKVKRQRKSIAKYAAIGGASGLGLSLILVANVLPSKWTGTFVLAATGVGTFYGAITGVIIQILNIKVNLLTFGNEEKFKANYKRLEEYVIAY